MGLPCDLWYTQSHHLLQHGALNRLELVAYHDAPVVIVGTGSGLSYAELGATHHSLEDMAIMRTIPNMRVCAPSDSIELITQLRQVLKMGNLRIYE